MAWNGSGTYSRTDGTYSGADTWEQNRDNGVKITVAAHDGHDQDLATAINNCLTKDVQNSPSAHATWVKSTFWGGTSGGTANAQTVSLSPAATAYATGMMIKFIPGNANTGGTTLNVNSIGTKTIKRPNGDALTGAELTTSAVAEVVYNGTDFILLNPAASWQSWTPTIGGANGVSLTTSTLQVARYYIDPNAGLCSFYASFSAGVNVAGKSLTLTEPVTDAYSNAQSVGSGIRALTGYINSNSWEGVQVAHSGSTFFIEASDGADWSSSTTYYINVNGQYRI